MEFYQGEIELSLSNEELKLLKKNGRTSPKYLSRNDRTFVQSPLSER